MNVPLLSTTVFLPLVGALLIALTPRTNVAMIRRLAFGFAGVTLALAIGLFFSYNQGGGGYQFVEEAPWVPLLGISYLLGVDGLNLPLVLLTALLSFLAVVASWQVDLRPKEYFALLLVLETGVLGVFTALDLLLFFLFWEVELIPMYLLIGIWGGPRREYASIKFVIYTLAGSAMMLVGILLLYFNATPHTFDVRELTGMQFAPAIASAAFLFLFLGFAVKLPVFPFHTWLPDAHVEAPTAVSVLLAGVLLKMGGYGLLRLNVGILPEATQQFGLLLGSLAVVNVLYGAMISMVQRDLKSLVAYSSVSHMGYVLLGIAALTPIALSGAAIQMFTHGMITALLFLIVGVVYERTHTRMIGDLGGLAARVPLIATIFIAAGLASLGLPATAGFVGEFTVFLGAYGALPLATILCIVGIVVTAGYILWMVRRVFFGPLNPQWASLTDARAWYEVGPLATLLALIILVGVAPSVLADVIHVTVPHLAGAG